MANPVFDGLTKEWARTPAGYPTMPGYQPMNGGVPASASSAGTAAPSRFDASYGTGSQPAYDQRAYEGLEASYDAPAADAVDRGRMTYDDVLVKTAICFVLLVASAGASWMLALTDLRLGLALATAGILVSAGLVLLNVFMKTTRPWLVLAYAIAEGATIGTISAIFEARFPGIVSQAVIATLVVFAVMLLLFTSGKVRHSPRLALITFVGLVGLLVSRLAVAVLQGFGVVSGVDHISVFGIPLGVIVGLVAVVIAALSLIQDFDAVKMGVEQGAPAVYAWSCAFGLMVTLVWMYTEILRILAFFANSED